MAYNLTHKYSFNTLQGDFCEIFILIKDSTAGLTILDPGITPFILREYNNDGDLFKHTRGFMAEMQFLNSNGVRMEDFLHDEDDGVLVEMEINGLLFWYGWLLQEDFEEPWIDTAHYITLRATDGLGTISGNVDMGVTGQATMLDFLNHCLNGTPIGNTFGTQAWIVCNLYYDGMVDRDDGSINTALNQVTTDVRTFEGDSRAEALQKVLRAWGMSLYQHAGRWWSVRLEEFLNGQTQIRGHRPSFFTAQVINKTFLVDVAKGGPVQAIMPEMLRSIRRPSKNNKISYYYRFPDELFCNQTFLRGDNIIPTLDTFEIDCWTLIKAPLNAPVTATSDWWRKEEKDADGNITDNYAFIAGNALETWMKSQALLMNDNDVMDIQVEYRRQRNNTAGSVSINIAIVQFISDAGGYYTLDDDGEWNLSTGPWVGNVKHLTMSYSPAENTGDWKTYTLRSKAVPGPGSIYLLLTNGLGTTGDANFKGLQIGIRERSKQPGVVGDYDQYTIDRVIHQDYEEETYLDDSNNRNLKGTLIFDGDLTGDNWYRMDYPDERLTFKRHKALAHVMLNGRYRQRLTVKMLGLMWDDGGVSKPVWLQNKFVFTDDAPTKIFMIANLQEMNFVDGTWSAQLIEVWDSELDSTDPADYPLHSFANIYSKDV